MEFLILPLLIGVLKVPAPPPSADQLADFSRLAKVVDQEVYVVDGSGQERRLTLLDAGDRAVRFMVGQQTLEMSRDAIVSVDRVRDRTIDGVIKGVLFGLLVGGIAEASIPNSNGGYLLRGALGYGTLGYLFDAGHVARQPVYRATVSVKTP
jgi:hypothetical protein